MKRSSEIFEVHEAPAMAGHNGLYLSTTRVMIVVHEAGDLHG